MVKVKKKKKETISNFKININNFIRQNKIDVIDIKFEVERVSTNKTVYYAMIIYRDRQIYG